MNAETQMRTAPSINGYMITLGAGHSVALYERNRECYVAEFRDGCIALAYAGSWFRFHAGALRSYDGRAALRSSMPLTRRCWRRSSDSTARARLANRECGLCLERLPRWSSVAYSA